MGAIAARAAAFGLLRRRQRRTGLPCYSLFFPVIFTKTGDFPWSSDQYVSLSVVFSVAYDLQGQRSLLRKTGIFFNVSGTLDLITGENFKRLRKRQLRSSPLLSLTLRSATAQGAPGHPRARVQIWAQQALRVQAPVGKLQKPRIS
jgi:hypothetical protein